MVTGDASRMVIAAFMVKGLELSRDALTHALMSRGLGGGITGVSSGKSMIRSILWKVAATWMMDWRLLYLMELVTGTSTRKPL